MRTTPQVNSKALVPTLPRGNAYGDLDLVFGMHSHAGAWERENEKQKGTIVFSTSLSGIEPAPLIPVQFRSFQP